MVDSPSKKTVLLVKTNIGNNLAISVLPNEIPFVCENEEKFMNSSSILELLRQQKVTLRLSESG